jgi:hypothetical protein
MHLWSHKRFSFVQCWLSIPCRLCPAVSLFAYLCGSHWLSLSVLCLSTSLWFYVARLHMLMFVLLSNIYWYCYAVICVWYYRSSSPYTTPHDTTGAGPSSLNEWQSLVANNSASPRNTFKARSWSQERSRGLKLKDESDCSSFPQFIFKLYRVIIKKIQVPKLIPEMIIVVQQQVLIPFSKNEV